jgi:integrase
MDTPEATGMPAQNPTPAILVREHRGKPFYEAFWRHAGRQVKRRIGPAWLTFEKATGAWVRRRGKVLAGFYDEHGAHVAAARLVDELMSEANERERVELERRTRGVTFREVAHDYMRWLEDVAGAKPSTLRDRQCVLGEPGIQRRRRTGETFGHVMAALGDRPAAKITTREVDALLTTVSKAGASPATVNKYRAVVSSVFNHGTKPSTYRLPGNPAAGSDKRREPQRGALLFYSPEEVEALARSLADGNHRSLAEERHQENPERSAAEVAEDHQDAEIILVAAYAGLRQGELLALRWRDVDFAGHALTIARAMSAGVESSTKSGKVRRVPMPDQAAAALDRLSRRENYTAPGELVFCNALGRPLDGSAIRRRFKRARDAAKIRPLRFHDLRHTYGSLLAAAGVDVVTIQAAMGHGALTTTSRYLHARPASEQAEVFTKAFATATEQASTEAVASA